MTTTKTTPTALITLSRTPAQVTAVAVLDGIAHVVTDLGYMAQIMRVLPIVGFENGELLLGEAKDAPLSEDILRYGPITAEEAAGYLQQNQS